MAIKNFLKKYKIEIILFLLAFVLRVGYAIVIQHNFGSDVFVSYSDATVYVKLANNIIYNNIFSEALLHPELVPDAMRTPGYPAFLVPFKFFNLPNIAIILVQDVLAGILAVLIYKIALFLFKNKNVGILSAVIFAVDPTMIYWSNLLMSDHLAGLFFAIFVLCFIKKRYVWAGLTIGIATQIRPVFFYLFPIVIVALLYMHWDSIKKYLKSKKYENLSFLKPILLTVFFFCLVIFPWMGRNYFQFGKLSLSSNGWMAIHFFISKPFADAHNIEHYWLEPPSDYYNFPGSNEMKRPNKYTYYHYEYSNHPFYKKFFIDMVSKHPVDYVKFHLTSSFKGFFKADYDYLVNYVLLAKKPGVPIYLTNSFLAVSYFFWYGLVLLALSTIWYKKYRFWAIFLLSFPAINVILTGHISVGSGAGRYNLPFYPFFVMLGVLGAFELYCNFLNKKNKKICIQKNISKNV